MGAEFARQIARQQSESRPQNSIDEIWLLARRADRLHALEEEIRGLKNDFAGRKKGGKESLNEGNSSDLPPKLPLARSFEIDLSGRDGVSAFAALLEAEKKGGAGIEITMLVNNAGFGTYGPFEQTALERELEMIDLNCLALTGICGIALPLMKSGSVLINTASLAAFMPLGNFAVYAATKAFVLSFSTALAAEVADKGIKVCALCPGSVSTEFAAVASNGARKEVLHGKSPAKTVAHCLKAARRSRHIALWAFKWKFTAFMSRFVGRYLCARFTYKFCKRPHADSSSGNGEVQ